MRRYEGLSNNTRLPYNNGNTKMARRASSEVCPEHRKMAAFGSPLRASGSTKSLQKFRVTSSGAIENKIYELDAVATETAPCSSRLLCSPWRASSASTSLSSFVSFIAGGGSGCRGTAEPPTTRFAQRALQAREGESQLRGPRHFADSVARDRNG